MLTLKKEKTNKYAKIDQTLNNMVDRFLKIQGLYYMMCGRYDWTCKWKMSLKSVWMML